MSVNKQDQNNAPKNKSHYRKGWDILKFPRRLNIEK